MSIEIWLDFIRNHFKPEVGQILVRSLRQDSLVWQFIKNEKTSLAFLETEPTDLSAFSPGKLAAWQVQQVIGIPLPEIDDYEYVLPISIKTRGAQALETTFHTGLPPADLFTAGLLALTLLERRKMKNSWDGISEELFTVRNQNSCVKDFHIWQTPFACLFSLCSDFDDLAEDFFHSSKSVIKNFIPIYIHSLLGNPMDSNQKMARMFPAIKPLSIDLQLESLKWLNNFHQDQLMTQLSKNLIQTKDNRDFFARVFSELESFEAVNPERDPLEKQVRFNLPEDINRMAAFHHFCGNVQKANETYQKSSDVLEFIKAQTLVQSLSGEDGHIPASRWLEIIKSVPHSKQARLFYSRSLIEENQHEEAKKQLADLQDSIEKQLLLNQIEQVDNLALDSLIKSTAHSKTSIDNKSRQQSSYFVHQPRINTQEEILNLIKSDEEKQFGLDWLDRYSQTDMNNIHAIKLALDLFEKNNQIDKAIEFAAILEQLEPSSVSYKRKLAHLYAQSGHWEKAYTFLQNLVKLDSTPEIKDLESFAEAALRTEEVDVSMSICQNILKREPDNTRALVLLGESFMKNGDVIKAIQHMEGVVTTIPTEPDAWITLAWLWQENDQLDRAVETLRKGVEKAPNEPKLLRKLGNAQLQQGKPQEALSTLKLANDLAPNNLEGKLDLAYTHHELEQPQKAYQLLENFLENYTEYPTAARLLGRVLMALNNDELAEPIMLFAANHFPEDLDTVISAARLLINRIEADPDSHDPPEILESLVEILQNSHAAYPQNEQLALYLADIDRIKGNHQKAFETYNQLIKTQAHEKSANEWHLNYGLGKAAMSLGNQEVALAALQTAINLKPSSLLVRHAMADALLMADLHEKANTIAKSALRLSPQNLNNILWYAKFNTRNNEPAEAVRALKEALQITPNQDELRLWLAEALISAGSLEEAHEEIKNFIASDEQKQKLLHQAAYTCIHLNDLELAAEALQEALKQASSFNPTLIMDLAVVYDLMKDHKKALELLSIEPSVLNKHPEIAMLKANFLGSFGQYEAAQKTLESIEDKVNLLPDETSNVDKQKNTSPLLYTHDLSQKGYHIRLGQLYRAIGNFNKAQEHLSLAFDFDPGDIKITNMRVETAMVNLELSTALKIIEEAENSEGLQGHTSQEVGDLLCSHAEILLLLNESNQAEKIYNRITQVSHSYPRILAIQSRIAAQNGQIDEARKYLVKAEKSIENNIGGSQSQDLHVIFRHIMNLYSIGEALLVMDEHRDAVRSWKQAHDLIDSQPLLNWRYLYTLVSGAEAQQIANRLAIRVNCPGDYFLSQETHKFADQLFEGLHDNLSQEQLVCLKARIISAFTGKWPLQLNVDACLQGAEEAAAVLLGSEDERLAMDILESYPDDVCVLQSYGVFALRHNLPNAAAYIEKALELDTANPINHALLAHLKLDQPEQALKSIEAAISIWPEEAEWHSLAADLNSRIGNTSAAEEHIQHALENEPTNADFWIKSAMLNVAANDLEKAKSDIEKSTSYQPEDAKAWSKMAEINQRMGNISEAVNNIRRASELDPDDQHIAEQEVQYLFGQSNYVDLETKANEIIAKDQTNEIANVYLAQALAKQGKFEQALSTLDTAIDRTPGNPRLALERIKIKKSQMGVEAVLPDLVNLAQNHANDLQILTTLTDWLIQSNRLDEAEEVAQTTLKNLPEQADIYLMLGRLQRIKGKLDQAVSHLSQAITLEPTLVDAYIELGKTYQERRDLEKAIEIYQKGSLANITDPRPYFHAGLALKDCKNYLEAEAMFKEAKKHAPDDTNIIRQLGVVTALNLINNLREAK